MTKIDWFVTIVSTILIVSLLGGYAGFTADGMSYEVSTEEPNIVTIFPWIWNSIQFYWCIITFQVDNCPVFINVFFQLISAIGAYLLVTLVRGN